jgi:hypothetical protein
MSLYVIIGLMTSLVNRIEQLFGTHEEINLSRSQPTEELIPLSKAAQQYGYPRATLFQAIQRGSLPARLGKIEIDAWYVQREDLENYIDRVKKKGKGPGTR